MKYEFWFSLQLWNISHSELARNDHKCILAFMHSTRYSGQILMKTEFSRQISKILKYQISWKSVQWEPGCSMWTEGQTWREANSRLSQFCERA